MGTNERRYNVYSWTKTFELLERYSIDEARRSARLSAPSSSCMFAMLLGILKWAIFLDPGDANCVNCALSFGCSRAVRVLKKRDAVCETNSGRSGVLIFCLRAYELVERTWIGTNLCREERKKENQGCICIRTFAAYNEDIRLVRVYYNRIEWPLLSTTKSLFKVPREVSSTRQPDSAGALGT